MPDEYKDLKQRLLEIKNRKKSLYCDDVCNKIRLVYLAGIIFWVIAVWMIGISVTSWGWFFFLVPIGVFIINMWGITGMKVDDEKIVLQSDFLSFAFLSVIILTNWKSKDISTDHKFFKILVISVILLVLSATNFAVGEDSFSILIHIKIIFQTTAMALIVWNLYLFYLRSDNFSGKEVRDKPGSDNKEDVKGDIADVELEEIF